MQARSPATRVRAGLAVLSSTEVVASVSVELQDGVIAGWEHVPEGSLSRAERETILTPGLINAHTHLDLGALRGAVSASVGFLGWVGDLVAARDGLSAGQVAAGVRASAWEALRTGTTSVIDIDSMGATGSALGEALPGAAAHGPRAFLLREVLDGSPAGRTARTESALELARAATAKGLGLSPHATHTVGGELMLDLGALLREQVGARIPVGIHWAETPEETEWLLDGQGPFAAWLGPSPGISGTERLARAGLLEGALLIHGNDPQSGEPERIAAAGCILVHCPGCHLFFGREPFPIERYSAAGVRLALGTDSWASNKSLDMRREMRLAAKTLGLDAPSVWRMATENGAASIPDPTITGTITEGAVADLVAFRQPDGTDSQDLASLQAAALQTLTQSEPEVQKVWVGGRPIASI